MSSIVLLYRLNDTKAALATTYRIHQRLVQRFGAKNIIQNVGTFPSNAGIKEHKKNILEHAKVQLIIIGPNWLDSKSERGQRLLEDLEDFIRLDIETALARNTPIIPILVDQAAIPKEDRLPSSLKKLTQLQMFSMRIDPDFDPDIKHVIKSIETYIDFAEKRQNKLRNSIIIAAITLFLALSSFIFLFWHFSLSNLNVDTHQPSINISNQVTDSRLQSIKMLSSTEGWAVGTHGTILHYKNGRWSRTKSPTTMQLTGLVMLSPNEGWAVGENGTILHYLKDKWMSIDSPTVQVLYGIAMLSNNEGWAVGEGGVILHYSNGRWGISSSPTTQLLGALVLNSGTDGWAVGRGGTILHFNGRKWSLLPGPNSSALLTSLCMISSQEGWAVGWDEKSNRGVILHFNKGHWSEILSPTNQWLGGITMLSATEGWIVGRDGTILHLDRDTWVVVNSPTTAFLVDVALPSSTEGWAVGWNEQANSGSILHYRNGVWSNYNN